MSKQSQIIKLTKELNSAKTYNNWLEFAEELDQLEGKDLWRQDDHSELYHSDTLKLHLKQIKDYRKNGKNKELLTLLHESLSLHSWELNNQELYTYARAGTKHLINNYLDEVDNAIDFICENKSSELSREDKLKVFETAERLHGHSILMLSGGGAFGIYHLGVTKALWEQDLLPHIISGASMGSVVAAGICSRNESELADLFNNTNKIHKVAMAPHSPIEAIQKKSIMNPDQLMEHIQENITQNFSFREAFEHSGRTLNIPVSPTRKRQKPRVLNHLTSPNVLIAHSSLASCAIPGLFPPVTLQAKDSTGNQTDYMPTEKWIDGSVHLDVPMKRIIRLHNVSRSIVSQANPHVLPFISDQKEGSILPQLTKTITSMVRSQAAKVLELAGSFSQAPSWQAMLDKTQAMVEQSYSGDININFPFRPELYPKMMANPNESEFQRYIHLGEQAAWSQLAFIRDQSRLNRALSRSIKKLKAK